MDFCFIVFFFDDFCDRFFFLKCNLGVVFYMKVYGEILNIVIVKKLFIKMKY